MSFEAQGWAWRQYDRTPAERIALLTMAQDESGWQSLDEWGTASGLGRGRWIRATSLLRQAGLIYIDHSHSEGGRNQYWYTLRMGDDR